MSMRYTGCCPADSDLEISWREDLDDEISMVKSPVFEEISHLMKILSNPIRLRIIMLLDKKDHSVYELMFVLREPQNLLSYNLGILKKNGLIESYYRSRHKTYHLTEKAKIELSFFLKSRIFRD